MCTTSLSAAWEVACGSGGPPPAQDGGRHARRRAHLLRLEVHLSVGLRLDMDASWRSGEVAIACAEGPLRSSNMSAETYSTTHRDAMRSALEPGVALI
jgi:hypothetical protein